MRDADLAGASTTVVLNCGIVPSRSRWRTGLRRVPTYEYEHRAYAKGRWYGRTIFDVFSSEFRDMSPDYYV